MVEHVTTRLEKSGWIWWFSNNPVAANLLMIVILAAGFYSLWNLRTEEFPASAPNMVTVTAAFDGGTPEIVEKSVAIKIEEALSGVEGVFRMTSEITGDQATVSIRAVDGYAVGDLKDEVTNRVNAITTFPVEVTRVLVVEAREVRDVLNLQIYGEADRQTLKDLARRIRLRLLELETINSIVIDGAGAYEINIDVSDEKLRAYSLSFEEVAQAVQRASLNASAGALQTSAGRITIQTLQLAENGYDLRNVIVRSGARGGTVKLTDVATIRDAFTDQQILSTFQGHPSVTLQVRLIGRDSITEAAAAVEAAATQMESEGWLPTGVHLAIWGNEAESIQESMQLLSTNALMGMALVIFLLALFLDPRIALWVAIGIPVSFAGTFFLIGPTFFDYSINNLTVFAFIVTLGIVVDDAIIIAESIFTYKRREGDGVEATVRGAQAVAVPATFGVLTTVAAFLPLAFMTGDFGGPFRLIAVVTIVCLLFSLVESKFILPAHLVPLRIDPPKSREPLLIARLWKRLQDRTEAVFAHFIENTYAPMLARVVLNRYQAVGGLVAVLVLTFGLIGGGIVKVVMFDEENGRMIFATVEMLPGSSASKTHDAARKIESAAENAAKAIMQKYALDEEQIVYSQVISTTDTSATVSLQIVPGTERPFFSEEFLNAWRDETGAIAGAKSLNFYVDFDEGQDIRIELSSKNTEKLNDAADELVERMRPYSAIRSLSSDADGAVREIDVKLLPLASELGLTNAAVITQLRNAVYGFEAQRIQRGEEEVRIKVRYPLSGRDDFSDIRHMNIRLSAGGTVPLSQVAELQWVYRPEQLQRIDGERVVVLSGMVNEEVITSSALLAVIERDVFPEVLRLYPSVKIKLAGESEAETDAFGKLQAGFLLGLLAVYALLAIPLKSYAEPFVILMAVPYGIVGAVLGHLIMGIPIGFLSFFGILALTGVVVNDALVLVSRYNQVREEGHDYLEAIVEAGKSRFRAVFLTSVTTFAGLMPLVLDRSETAQELIPMAVSLAFGVLFATVITLLIIPVLMGISEDAQEWVEGRRAQRRLEYDKPERVAYPDR